jgi:hypothetical protein
MKLSDFIFQFPIGIAHTRQGLCRVRTFFGPQSGVTALLTDLGEFVVGSSITNSVEHIHQALLLRGMIQPDARVIEHYERHDGGGGSFSGVSFGPMGDPSWARMSMQDVLSTLSCDSSEFKSSTAMNLRLVAEIERLRNAIDPFADAPWLEEPEIVNRRETIESGMISKAMLSQLVNAGATERQFQELLKRDPSFFGEVYGDPHEEYIVLSEYPLADGFIDFVVFTGRSRMEVVLIEIKGADFFLVNDDSYAEFSHKVNQAAGQIRRRIGDIYRDMSTFRRYAHKVRHAVESGAARHGAFMGPHPKLLVDSDKDIEIRSVVIGGRTRDDFSESKKRHDFEHGMSPPIRIESWDTWIRKLQRQ